MNTEDIMDLVREYGSTLQSSSFAYECGNLGGSKNYDKEAEKLFGEIESAINAAIDVAFNAVKITETDEYEIWRRNGRYEVWEVPLHGGKPQFYKTAATHEAAIALTSELT